MLHKTVNRTPRVRRFLCAGALFGLAGCSLSDLVKTDLPSTSTDPESLNTPLGAFDRYKGTIQRFRSVVSGSNSQTGTFVWAGALLGDEMGSGEYNIPSNGNHTKLSAIDGRSMSDHINDPTANAFQIGVWSGLAATRLSAQDAIHALKTYAPQSPPDQRGHAHALQGMAEVMLAELYCSGIPLTTLRPGGGFDYGVGLSTEDVLAHAIAQFDTAITLIQDSTDLLNFARVGRARALLNLGRFDDARLAVANVPDNFTYKNLHSLLPAGAVGIANFTSGQQVGTYGVLVDGEGGRGLDYLSANDPRVLYTDTVNTQQGFLYPDTRIVLPNKLMKPNSAQPIVVADGIEARLIEAEAALRANDPAWLTTLNRLRTTCTDAGTCPTPAPAGAGGIANLPPLQNPATQGDRVDMLFRERAFWLFMTGHRHGDMRRLIRQYGRAPESVFPTGLYPVGPVGTYGNDVNLPAPATEQLNNPKYSGCINRNA